MSKEYSQSEVEEIIKNTFNAARELIPANSPLEKLRREILKEEFTMAAKFETFKDYQSSLKSLP